MDNQSKRAEFELLIGEMTDAHRTMQSLFPVRTTPWERGEAPPPVHLTPAQWAGFDAAAKRWDAAHDAILELLRS